MKDLNNQKIEILATPEKTIPKYSTNVNFNKLKNGDIVFSFLMRNQENSPATLIETIIVDEDHAKQIVEVLSKVISNNT